ncbi:hypothetical protein [Echinicola sp. 20G]|uniref:hypothetical protein n=1 Tax=Echinicola sp. 20G TaxID=2781961 RepID=UPI001910FCCA|nr:hypothetical protein [Echinicola sp. 20G]
MIKVKTHRYGKSGFFSSNITSIDWQLTIKDILSESNLEKSAINSATGLLAMYSHYNLVPEYIVFEISIDNMDEFIKVEKFISYFMSFERIEKTRNVKSIIRDCKMFIVNFDSYTIEKDAIGPYEDKLDNLIRSIFGNNFKYGTTYKDQFF